MYHRALHFMTSDAFYKHKCASLLAEHVLNRIRCSLSAGLMYLMFIYLFCVHGVAA